MSAEGYVARTADPRGYIDYSDSEHSVWAELMARQQRLLPGRACNEFLEGLERLQLAPDRIAQLPDLNRVLKASTGWQVVAVPALIDFARFFGLLADRCFPVATFIRRPDELDYLKEPDIFHEVFGHCPLLTNPWFAAFTQVYGAMGLRASKAQRPYLARLYWMTVEFGLVDTAQGLRIYGGGILSSPKETAHALSDSPEHVPFQALEAMRTPYRIDIVQPVYFVLPQLQLLQTLAQLDLLALADQAAQLGLHPAKFPAKAA